VYASDRAIGTFVAWFSTFLASLLLIGAVVVLYKVHSPDWRLGLIAAFTTLFAGSVGLLTNARRAELFAATAAYEIPADTVAEMLISYLVMRLCS
jgi:hypothetical protein